MDDIESEAEESSGDAEDEGDRVQSMNLLGDPSFDRIINDFEEQRLADGKVLEDLKRQLAIIDKKIKDAEDKDDLDEAQQLDRQRADIEKYLKKLRKHGGRIRTFSGKERRANQSVPLAIRRALKLLEKPHSQLHTHLGNSLKFGPELSYRPDVATSWTI